MGIRSAKANARQRAKNGLAIERLYAAGKPTIETLSDLLTDLMHAHGRADFNLAMGSASYHYHREAEELDDLARDATHKIARLPIIQGIEYAWEESAESPFIDFEPRFSALGHVRAFLAANGYDFSEG